MKKVGKLTEARMVPPEEPKYYPLVSDSLFENAVRGYKGVKGGTTAAAKIAARKKKLEEDELPMDKAPDPSLSNTNSPRRATKASVQVGGPFDLTASQKGKRQDEDKDWIQGAEADIERRGTEGKCTPITKPGCTGKAKALAKTFKKMARKRKAKNEAAENPDALRRRLEKERVAFRKKAPLKKPGLQPGQQSIGDRSHPDHKPANDPLTDAFEPLAKPRGTWKGARQATKKAEMGKTLSNKEHGAVMRNRKASPALRTTSADQHTPS